METRKRRKKHFPYIWRIAARRHADEKVMIDKTASCAPRPIATAIQREKKRKKKKKACELALCWLQRVFDLPSDDGRSCDVINHVAHHGLLVHSQTLLQLAVSTSTGQQSRRTILCCFMACCEKGEGFWERRQYLCQSICVFPSS